EWYRKIVDSGFEASQVYYNMGNCYYKQDRTGLAVLYYEKARKLNPNDREINENLQLANLKVKDRIELPPQFFL
ncbi:MAG: tetratricopeptide repeat protein, partial [Calditrichaeota bacterium]|nr:tetratricopeptide repeat protein [Calditrichota bacterium]